MSRLPVFVSVPHAGQTVPPEIADLCLLTPEQIRSDGDEGANEIYDIESHVAGFLTTDVPRCIVDLNRSESDRRPDGIVKTVSIWNEPVYSRPLTESEIERLLDRYYRPYHRQLENEVIGNYQFMIDCHTMVEIGPAVAPDAGKKRPMICLGDCDGKTFPSDWLGPLTRCFEEQFENDVQINRPFSGGYIVQTHGLKKPFIQLEVSRSPKLSNLEKRTRVLRALKSFCDLIGH